MNNILSITITSLLLASCSMQCSNIIKPLTLESFFKPQISPIQLPFMTNESMLFSQKKIVMNWRVSLSEMVNKLTNIKEIKNGSILIVYRFKNHINEILNSNEVTDILASLIKESGNKFNIIDKNELNLARKKLGLSKNDILESLSKDLWLARNLNATYILYCSIIGNINQPNIDIRLMLVKTGEIIWVDNDCDK